MRACGLRIRCLYGDGGRCLRDKRRGRCLGDVLPIIEAGGIFEYARQAGMLK